MASELLRHDTSRLDEIIITDEISKRPNRIPDLKSESEALHSLARAAARGSQATLEALAVEAVRLCKAGAGGVSLLDTRDGKPGVFRWVALAGSYESYLHNTTPGDHSPCAVCLERNSAQLYRYPARYFEYFRDANPPIVEGLVVPLRAGDVSGTIWAVSHTEAEHFTSEDVRVMTSLADFAGAALAMSYANDELRARSVQLETLQGKLNSQRRFAEQVIESSADCLKILDLEGRLVSMNSAGRALMEIDDFSSCQNSVWSEFWQGNSGQEARAAFAAAKGGKRGSFEGPCSTAKGTPKWWHVLVSPVVNEDGITEAVVVVSRDITERHQTDKLIREARDAAEEANRKKDLFLAALSHELRTPLSPVVLALRAMDGNKSLPAEVQQYMHMIRRNVDLEIRLIDDLLDVSRAVSGKLRLDKQRASVHELLRFVEETCASEANHKRISFKLDLAASRDAADVDAARMQQAFWNLLKNAIKFSDEGQTIEITTANGKSNSIEIRFRDHGIGIAPDTISGIFAAFDQGPATTTQRFGGLGLGLAISKSVVELHGGTIRAESEGLRKGALFTVEIPLSETASALMPSIVPDVAPLKAQGLKVLVVEDHADTAELMAVLLKGSGFRVKTAGTGAAALEAVSSEAFDIIVSDVGLPDMNGYDLMRNIGKQCDAKGIAMTGYGMDEDFAKSRAAGFAAHVVKPIDFAQLEKTINRVMTGSS